MPYTSRHSPALTLISYLALQQAGAGGALDLGEEGLYVLLHQAVKRGLPGGGGARKWTGRRPAPGEVADRWLARAAKNNNESVVLHGLRRCSAVPSLATQEPQVMP